VNGRWIDVILLDALVRLADGEQEPPLRSEAELLGNSAPSAAGDLPTRALALCELARRLWLKATGIAAQAEFATAVGGPLGLGIQVAGAIVAGRAGHWTPSSGESRRIREQLTSFQTRQHKALSSKVQRVFSYLGNAIEIVDDLPQVKTPKLDTLLREVHGQIRDAEGRRFAKPEILRNESSSGRSASRFVIVYTPSHRPEDWPELILASPELRQWSEVTFLSRAVSWLNDDGRTQSSWSSFPRLGMETSWQVLRYVFEHLGASLSPGRSLICVDMNDIAARALAAVCKRRYGCSALTEEAGDAADLRDVVGRRATAISGVAVRDVGEGLLSLIASRIGANHLTNVVNVPACDRNELRRAFDRVLNDFAGLRWYYEDGIFRILATNLGVEETVVRDALQEWEPATVNDVICGVGNGPESDGILRQLAQIEQHGVVQAVINGEMPLSQLESKLLTRTITTATGRIRRRTYFNRHTAEWADLADDAIKLFCFGIVTGISDVRPICLLENKIVLDVAQWAVPDMQERLPALAGDVGNMVLGLKMRVSIAVGS